MGLGLIYRDALFAATENLATQRQSYSPTFVRSIAHLLHAFGACASAAQCEHVLGRVLLPVRQQQYQHHSGIASGSPRHGDLQFLTGLPAPGLVDYARDQMRRLKAQFWTSRGLAIVAILAIHGLVVTIALLARNVPMDAPRAEPMLVTLVNEQRPESSCRAEDSAAASPTADARHTRGQHRPERRASGDHHRGQGRRSDSPNAQ